MLERVCGRRPCEEVVSERRLAGCERTGGTLAGTSSSLYRGAAADELGAGGVKGRVRARPAQGGRSSPSLRVLRPAVQGCHDDGSVCVKAQQPLSPWGSSHPALSALLRCCSVPGLPSFALKRPLGRAAWN